MDKETHKQQHQKIAGLLKYFRLIMAIFYFIMGLSIAFLPYFADIDTTVRYGFAAMLCAYGVFRFYRQFNSKEDEED